MSLAQPRPSMQAAVHAHEIHLERLLSDVATGVGTYCAQTSMLENLKLAADNALTTRAATTTSAYGDVLHDALDIMVYGKNAAPEARVLCQHATDRHGHGSRSIEAYLSDKGLTEPQQAKVVAMVVSLSSLTLLAEKPCLSSMLERKGSPLAGLQPIARPYAA